ncbi:MAG: hypothetical protein AAFP20_12150 [Cyanobacteria bacterium J06614_10]
MSKQSFRRFSATGWSGLFTAASLLSPTSIIDTSVVNSDTVIFPEPVTSAEENAIELPDWLVNLDLNDVQINQVVEIDNQLEQRLELILTGSQYRQWQSSQATLSEETWNFEDLGIYLSPYQQAAVDVSFQSAMQNLLNILSSEQRQQLIQTLSEENAIPDSGSEI